MEQNRTRLLRHLARPSPPSSSPAGYLLSFGSMSCPWVRDNSVHVETINESDVIFGKFDIVEDYILINHILLLAKYYIYCRKCHNSVPSIQY